MGGQWITYPKLDCGPMLSLLSRLPTAMTPGPAAGVTLHASVFPFPPATTTVMPACDTYRQPAHQNNAARATRKWEVGEQQWNNPERLGRVEMTDDRHGGIRPAKHSQPKVPS